MSESKCSESSKISNMENTEIAGKLKIKDWNELKGKLEPEIDEYWCDAFSYFEKRIETRYLNPIRCIQNMNLNLGEGFAIVNLQCSLIETIESFYNGWIYNYPKYLKNEKQAKCQWDLTKNINSENLFISFFKYRIPENLIDGSDFYKNVRCGLLHETQTKKGWKILAEHENQETFFEETGSRKIIYRKNFQKTLGKVIRQYKQAIVDGKEYGDILVDNLRQNFKIKFNHICELS